MGDIFVIAAWATIGSFALAVAGLVFRVVRMRRAYKRKNRQR
jgi:hypothetical protein